MRTVTLLAFLLLGACSGESESTSSTDATAQANVSNSNESSSQPVTTPGANANADVGEAQPIDSQAVQAAFNDSGIQQGNKPLIPAQQPQAKYEPKREPQFGFQPGGPISDEDLKDYHIEIAVSIDGSPVGTIHAEMWPQFAPITVRNFLRYADEGFYDGLTFHRVLRDFMAQGGDPNGNGQGDGPHGSIVAEFTMTPERKHGYGVFSMARGPGQPNSASSQFFIVCSEGPSTWGLDGQYSSFAKMTKGVETLEAIANVPVGAARPGQPAQTPKRKIVMTSVQVKKGEAPTSEVPIERPAPELNGEPAIVNVQHILISYVGAPSQRPIPGVTRTKEEAEKLVQELTKRAKDGEDFSALVKEHSDDPVNPADAVPGMYVLLNNGVQDLEYERAMFELSKEADQLRETLMAQVQAKAITQQDAQKQYQETLEPKLAALGDRRFKRSDMASAFSDVAFNLGVGQIDVATPDAATSPFGWHIIKRLK